MAQYALPNVIIGPNACAAGVPSASSTFQSVTATSFSIQGLPITLGDDAVYTLVAAIPTAELGWMTTYPGLGPECTINTFTFSTSGPTSVLKSLRAITSATGGGSATTTMVTTTLATTISTTAASIQTLSTPSPLGHGSPAAAMVSGFIIIWLFGAFIGGLVVFLVLRCRRRRRAAAARSGLRSDAVPAMVEPLDRPFGAEDGAGLPSTRAG
jgi:hypothetical protein